MFLFRRSFLFAVGTGAFTIVLPRIANAQPPAAELLARLAVFADNFEKMKTRANFVVSGKLDEVASDGQSKNTKEMTAEAKSDGAKLHFTIMRYFEDGQDKTAEAQKKEADKKAENKPQPASRPQGRMPFHAGEQPRYNFDQIEVDPNDPTRVRIAFVPKIKEDDTIEGSAWVDSQSGNLLSAGFKLCKPPTAVDYVNVQMTFAANTSLGPALSKIDVEAAGGILFVRKHFRGSANLSNITITP